MKFEWDPAEAKSIIAKHDITFEEASSVFDDLFSATSADPKHPAERLITLGISDTQRLLWVVHTEHGDVVRIISAPRATKHERRLYEQG